MKLSGELLAGDQGFGISTEGCLVAAQAIKTLSDNGIEVGVVIGGGNIFRGVQLESMGVARSPADQMGMLATLMNGIALQQALHSIGVTAKVFSGLDCPRVAEPFVWSRVQESLRDGHPLIFVGGTGNPYFTTDTTAALRASEIEADVLLKATKVDGVYSQDPLKHPDAVRYEQITYSEVLAQKLAVMDATAIALCRGGNIPILVFSMSKLVDGEILGVLESNNSGTLVTEG